MSIAQHRQADCAPPYLTAGEIWDIITSETICIHPGTRRNMMITRSPNVRTVLRAAGLLAALGLLYLAGRADASLRQKTKREPQKASNAQLRQALQVLHATKLTLEAADHDYGGHRVDAVKAIGAAQHQLKLALGTQVKHKKPAAPGAGKPANPGKGGKGNEAQNVSNMQLADAIPLLHNTALLLEKADHDYGGHRAAAVRDLGAAVKQLKVALQFEKKK
jgi:hypothetical protein